MVYIYLKLDMNFKAVSLKLIFLVIGITFVELSFAQNLQGITSDNNGDLELINLNPLNCNSSIITNSLQNGVYIGPDVQGVAVSCNNYFIAGVDFAGDNYGILKYDLVSGSENLVITDSSMNNEIEYNSIDNYLYTVNENVYSGACKLSRVNHFTGSKNTIAKLPSASCIVYGVDNLNCLSNISNKFYSFRYPDKLFEFDLNTGDSLAISVNQLGDTLSINAHLFYDNFLNKIFCIGESQALGYVVISYDRLSNIKTIIKSINGNSNLIEYCSYNEASSDFCIVYAGSNANEYEVINVVSGITTNGCTYGYENYPLCYESCSVNFVSENESLYNLESYPNPTHSSFTISGINTNDFTSIEILDITGKLLFTTKSSIDIDLSNYENGVYFYRIIGEMNYMGKMVKE
jgi:hypothetical protein